MTRITPILGLLAIAALLGVFAPSISSSIVGLSESRTWMLIGVLSFILVFSAAWTILGAIDRIGADDKSVNLGPVPDRTQNAAAAIENGARLSPRAA